MVRYSCLKIQSKEEKEMEENKIYVEVAEDKGDCVNIFFSMNVDRAELPQKGDIIESYPNLPERTVIKRKLEYNQGKLIKARIYVE
jgi:hypothetical protein